MKIARYKRVKKILSFYSLNFSLCPPYHVLADGTFCKTALDGQVNLREQLPKYLGAEVKLHTTHCALAECKALGSLLYGPLKILETYTITPCKHRDNPVQAATCVYNTARQMCSNGKACFLATCDPEISQKVQQTIGLPLLYISHKTLTLAPPSPVSEEHARRGRERAVREAPSQAQAANLQALKASVEGPQVTGPAKRKRKGPRQPNPLSCKKKRKVKVESVEKAVTETDAQKKRSRKRHRRVKETLSNGATP